jgi:hypothetical protein
LRVGRADLHGTPTSTPLETFELGRFVNAPKKFRNPCRQWQASTGTSRLLELAVVDSHHPFLAVFSFQRSNYFSSEN